MKKNIILLLAFNILIGTNYALALEEPIIFPKEGQAKAQQQDDKIYCKMWAKDETGVDPSYLRAKIEATNDNVQRAATGKEPSMGRRLLRGAALGAAMGGIDDGIDNDIGKRAVQGLVLSGAKTRDDKKDYHRQKELSYQSQKKEMLTEQYDKYFRAFSVCMDAKGYSVR